MAELKMAKSSGESLLEHGKLSRLNESWTQTCKPLTNLAFVNTHKTGSTTQAMIINRFGFTRKLSFMYNQKHSHGHFTVQKLEVERLLPPLCVREGDYGSYRNYNLMTAHFRMLPNLVQVRFIYDLADRDNFGSPEEVSRMIRRLDRIIDLVLIAEYFDESLVILQRLMCWDFKDIVYITQNAREEKFRSE
nr:galactose-3-O-sulfotransferase 3-like [Lytechinus pictus]